MKFRATVAIFSPSLSIAAPLSSAIPFRFANKMHSTAGGAIEKARPLNTVKATIIVRDIENFSSLTAMCVEETLQYLLVSFSSIRFRGNSLLNRTIDI